MEIFELIEKRRSVYPHQFSSGNIAEKEIEKLLKTANWAPTHRKTEPWRFKVLTGESKQKAGMFFKNVYLKTAEKPIQFKAKKIVEKFEKSSHVIAVCMQRDPKKSVPEWEEVAATAMAVQNMWLASKTLNIGMYWSTPAHKDSLGDFLPLNEGEKCLGFLYLGRFYVDLPVLERQSTIDAKTLWYL